MGFDPRKPFEKRKSDIFFVFFGLVIIVFFVLWAFLG